MVKEFSTFWETRSSLKQTSPSQEDRKISAAETTIMVIPKVFLSV